MSKVCIIVNVDAPQITDNELAAAWRAKIGQVYNMLANQFPCGWVIYEDAAMSQLALYLVQMKLYGKIEFLSAGRYAGQDLSALSYPEQQIDIATSKAAVASIRACGRPDRPVTGFFSVSQNADTDTILATVGSYDATEKVSADGFMPMHDIDFKNAGQSPAQWLAALKAKFDSGEDMVAAFDLSLSSTSGKIVYSPYYSAYKYYTQSTPADWVYSMWQFIEYVKSKGGQFVYPAEI